MADYARHDMMFKEAFGDPVLASALLEEVLPDSLLTRIVPDSLTPRKDTFISEDRRELLADLLFDVTMKDNEPGRLYLLFEHKSTPDQDICL